ncbi:hypothetical protein WJX81_004386 [Elliptochloris bilobata]|uniref:Protein preY, mitochondrial n=1 Tax=Elliptochloris bilobata TaxID=381761 RepID=A0AAW1S9R7_9CHLO
MRALGVMLFRRWPCQLQAMRCSVAPGGEQAAFDASVLEFLVCPMSKQPLRYDAAASELVCETLAVAYPVRNGLPFLRPGDSRVLKAEAAPSPGGASASAAPGTSPAREFLEETKTDAVAWEPSG